MRVALVNGRLLLDSLLVESNALVVDGTRITSIEPVAGLDSAMSRYDLNNAIVVPGFIDVQVNGGGGILFNDAPTPEGIRSIGNAHARFGTTGFLPTLISADYAAISRAMDAVDAAIEAGVPGVLGIHIEGPFLSRARQGIHDGSQFRAPDETTLSLLTTKRRGVVVITLAPEIVPPDTIQALRQAGVIVCAGHTDADYETVRKGLESGINGFTHLFNAMSPMRARLPGVIGAALEDRNSWCGLIADGHHVHPACLKIALAAKGLDRLMLVTDAMPSVGAMSKTFQLQGRNIIVEDGACKAADGTLAGSDLDMATAIRNSMSMMDLTLAQAVRLGSTNAAQFLGIESITGRLAPGLRADFVMLDNDYQVIETWIGGEQRLEPLRWPTRSNASFAVIP
jgi:N-acetylglucosamine-6-phosphate deacetylase